MYNLKDLVIDTHVHINLLIYYADIFGVQGTKYGIHSQKQFSYNLSVRTGNNTIANDLREMDNAENVCRSDGGR